MMRILVADDHDLVRDTIAAFLRQSESDVIARVSNLPAALDRVRADGPYDLVLLDYKMPGMEGLDGLAQMRALQGDNAVAILSGHATSDIAEAALKAGARGFIPKTLSADAMLNAARLMMSGEVFVPFEFLQTSGPDTSTALTKREIDVLQGIGRGQSNKEIARVLDLQEVTVKLHIKTLSRKLEARNRTHAAMIGRDRGLI